MLRFFLYLTRWQLSTPIMAPVMAVVALWLGTSSLASLLGLMLANLVGGIVFFFIDRYIFTAPSLEVWEISDGCCNDCGAHGKVKRLVLFGKYDRRDDPEPEYRCAECSPKKLKRIQEGLKT